MQLFFKLKNIEDLDYHDQSKVITKQVLKTCKFSDKEVKFNRFFTHTLQKSPTKIKDFSIGVYVVIDDNAKEAIYLKLLNPLIYDYFDLLVLV